MGVLEVLKNVRKVKKNFKLFENDFTKNLPDSLILIDYPGFNLRIAPVAKKLGIPIHYYIAPKVWAWGKSRIPKIKVLVDFLYTILPFEPAYFKKHGIVSDYVGNPLLDLVSEFKQDQAVVSDLKSGKPIIALLPGSRKMELANILPIMSSVAKYFPDYRFVMAGSDSFSDDELAFLRKLHGVEILRGKTYEILSVAKAALVASGTATLETALWNVPQVVCYRFSKISYWIAKPLIKIKYISLVNLIMDKPIVKELIQNNLTEATVKSELGLILKENRRQEILIGYAALRIKVGEKGASQRVASMIVNRTKK